MNLYNHENRKQIELNHAVLRQSVKGIVDESKQKCKNILNENPFNLKKKLEMKSGRMTKKEIVDYLVRSLRYCHNSMSYLKYYQLSKGKRNNNESQQSYGKVLQYLMNGLQEEIDEDPDIEVILEDDVYSATFYDWFMFRRKSITICLILAATQFFLLTMIFSAQFQTLQANQGKQPSYKIAGYWIDTFKIMLILSVVANQDSEIRNGLQIINISYYLKSKNTQKVSKQDRIFYKVYGKIVGYMQVISCLFTIFVQFIFILTMTDIPELIKGYAAIALITQLDNYCCFWKKDVQVQAEQYNLQYLKIKIKASMMQEIVYRTSLVKTYCTIFCTLMFILQSTGTINLYEQCRFIVHIRNFIVNTLLSPTNQ